jgi:hypothetical protein
MMHPEVKVSMRLPPFIPATQVYEKKHPNEARWKVQGLRVPSKEERARIYKEERVVGPQPYPGQASMYESFLQTYDPKSKERAMLASGKNNKKRGVDARKTKGTGGNTAKTDEDEEGDGSNGAPDNGLMSLDAFVATKRRKTRKTKA